MSSNKMSNDNIDIEKLQKELAMLREQLKAERAERAKEVFRSSISQEQVEIFAEKVLDKVNMKYVPDSVELSMYKNLIRMFLEVFKETLETIKIDLMGHEIRLKIESK